MAFPVNLDANAPANTENPNLGASRIRAITQAVIDLFNLPPATNIGAALTITRVGPLTNQTGVTLNAGDVVALDLANDASVALSDVQGSLRQFVVALATISAAAIGVFGQVGQATVTVQNAVTRGNYLRKSATTRALEDTGVAQSSTNVMPAGAVGVALTGFAGPGAGSVTASLFGSTSASTFPRPQAGRLKFVSVAQIKFVPLDGTLLPVKTAGVWQLRDIGAGITSANPTTTSNFVNGTASQALAANTTYLVTVFDNAGTLTFDFLTTLTHVPDATTGTEIKNGDDTRTVVGMVRTDVVPNFEDDIFLRGVISWFNRRNIGLVNHYTANRSTTSATYVEFNSEIRGNFLTWADETVLVGVSGGAATNVAAVAEHSIGFDGTTAEDAYGRTDLTTTTSIGLSLVKHGLSEGFHYATHLGRVAGGNTLSVAGGGLAAATSLTVGIRG